MPLLTTWSPYFQSRDRQRGRGYFQEGRVHRQPPGEGEVVRAQVTGQDGSCTVTFQTDDSATTAQCTCEQSSSGVFCAHIWAALVAVQEGNGEFMGELQPGALTNPRPPRARKRSEDRSSVLDAQPAWATRLDMIRPTSLEQRRFEPPAVLAHYRVCYVVRPALSLRYHGLVVDLVREPWGEGGWAYAKPKRIKVSLENVRQLPDPVDRQLCGLLLGAQPVVGHHEDGDDWVEQDRGRVTTRFVLSPAAQGSLLEKILQTGRCFVEDSKAREILDSPLKWGGDEPWVLWLKGERAGEGLEVDLELRRGDRVVGLDQPVLVLPGASGLVIDGDKVSPLDDCGAFTWVVQFRDGHQPSGGQAKLTIPAEDVSRFLDRLYRLPQLPRLDLPEGVGYPEKRVTPTACLELWHLSDTSTGAKSKQRRFLAADLWFDYEQQRVKPHQPGWFVSAIDVPAGVVPAGVAEGSPSVLIHRDVRFEAEAMALLGSLGFRRSASTDAGLPALLVPTRRVPEVVTTLIGRGWSVMADQKALRRPAAPVMSVKTGIDWFELRGGVKYQTASGEVEVGLPEILAAARAGREMVTLSDGSQGVLPQQWLEENGLLAAIGQVHEDHVRFKSTQAMILDSLLSQQPAVSVDKKFAAVRERLQRLHALGSVEPTSRFQGHLRSYQNEGLVWLEYLRAVGLGGILADDMGLGKTVQVLGMLDRVYSEGGSATAPTLIVVPRSIVFNWLDEAARFTPHLKAQGYTGSERHALREAFADHHVIVTTYGLLRRDIADLERFTFEYVVLDEAQAIKNPDSQSAQAARVLKANHRLALTGTPVENHLGDLWSIFEYLNPGMLGSNARFARLIRSVVGGRRGAIGLEPKRAAKREAAQRGGGNRVAPIAKAMGPFILRRTKQQVLQDLPEKTEQTIVCQMEPAQRAVYDQLLTHYRSTLLGRRPGRGGGGAFSGGSAMIVLEALLRLRQAACHPALIDEGRVNEPSAKLDVLLDRLADLVEEGHKALVFSQFTSLLAIVRKRLDERGMVYEYLDGQTNDRAARVERFQTDPHCPVFLISLKAGGLGLNLTAAEYVFILDPWWNPAVEAQAVDRAHRIGQNRHVFAYRLICQDTVEQRIAELQQRKRTLAEAVVGGQDEGVLASLSREDLQYLLT